MWWVLNGPKRKSAPRELLERYERCCPDLDSLQPILEAYEADFAARIAPRLPAGVTLHALRLYETATSYAEWYAEDNPDVR